MSSVKRCPMRPALKAAIMLMNNCCRSSAAHSNFSSKTRSTDLSVKVESRHGRVSVNFMRATK